MTLSTLCLFLLLAENIDAGGLGWVKSIQQFQLATDKPEALEFPIELEFRNVDF